MRAQHDDSFYRLDNPRTEASGGAPRSEFRVRFKTEHQAKRIGTHLVIRERGRKIGPPDAVLPQQRPDGAHRSEVVHCFRGGTDAWRHERGGGVCRRGSFPAPWR